MASRCFSCAPVDVSLTEEPWRRRCKAAVVSDRRCFGENEMKTRGAVGLKTGGDDFDEWEDNGEHGVHIVATMRPGSLRAFRKSPLSAPVLTALPDRRARAPLPATPTEPMSTSPASTGALPCVTVMSMPAPSTPTMLSA